MMNTLVRIKGTDIIGEIISFHHGTVIPWENINLSYYRIKYKRNGRELFELANVNDVVPVYQED